MAASPDQADSNSHLDGLSTRMDLMFDHYWILWKKDGLRQMFDSKIDKLRKEKTFYQQ